MWDLYIWVPTKGWKLVRRFKKEKEEVARTTAKEFTPLEVKLISPTGKRFYGGQHCMPNHDSIVQITETL